MMAMYAISSITMRSGKGKESSDSDDGKSKSFEGKSEDVHARQVSHQNMEEAVLGLYLSAAGGYGIDYFGFHLYGTLTTRSDLTAQEAAFMARYKLYQVHLTGLVKECMDGKNSTETARAAESGRAAKIARTNTGGDYEANLYAFLFNMLAESKEAENAKRVAQGLPEKTSEDDYDQDLRVDSESDCEIVEDRRGQGGQGGESSGKDRT